MWAILSGIEGNLAAYEAVLADIKRQRVPVEELYILGDLVSARPESEQVVRRIRYPRSGELQPQVCLGWWEEQCFNLHGLGTTAEATELLNRYGGDAVQLLWQSVSRETVQWLRGLDFGFFELDCLLIHGSSISVSDELTPQTPPWQVLDRLQRFGANNLFCGRSGLVFEYHLQEGSVATSVTTLDAKQPIVRVTMPQRRVIGVGNVGREPGKATYTLYNPNTDKVEFKTVFYGQKKGFSSTRI
ncbi:metallophosphoesterase [Candidatus Gracilibacteria bacterium]|nr:metallophosphoesterase [Candidatus Gracilibacteria bacterium]NJM89389.1 metallophosphoesterase [Hydrococcus sp. RU_2_2]NJP21628.1 metallophosphoesterase [Hydrococcus sp. CRU_1_1]